MLVGGEPPAVVHVGLHRLVPRLHVRVVGHAARSVDALIDTWAPTAGHDSRRPDTPHRDRCGRSSPRRVVVSAPRVSRARAVSAAVFSVPRPSPESDASTGPSQSPDSATRPPPSDRSHRPPTPGSGRDVDLAVHLVLARWRRTVPVPGERRYSVSSRPGYRFPASNARRDGVPRLTPSPQRLVHPRTAIGLATASYAPRRSLEQLRIVLRCAALGGLIAPGVVSRWH